MDMRRACDFTDYFVIASGNSQRQVRSIAQAIEDNLREHGQSWRHEGKKESLWVLLDCTDVVVHIFYYPLRSFYNLERLWGDVPVTDIG
jgi:ribosome-associated protein